jgi:hypothetical protein
MTPTPTGQVIPTAIGRDLVLERVLPGSIDDAWVSITESDRLARWFCTWSGEPRVGATLELSWSPRTMPPRRRRSSHASQAGCRLVRCLTNPSGRGD